MPTLELVVSLTLKAALLLALTAAVAGLARRASAAIQHLIWTTGLVATLGLPLVALAVPAWPALPAGSLLLAADPTAPLPARAPIPPRAPTAPRAPEPAAPPEAIDRAAATTLVAGASTPLAEASPAAPAPVASVTTPVASATTPIASAPTPTEPASAGTLATTLAPALAPAAWGAGLAKWLAAALWLWALGTAAVAAWLVAGMVAVRRLAASAVPLQSPAWIDTVADVLADRPLRRSIRFLESETVGTPCTWGTVRPTILLPTVGVDWTEARRRQVVVHELAHVVRFDCLTHLLGRLACAVYWFNPLVWVAARQARVARELACDDAVLNDGGLPSDYADLLLETARTAQYGAEVPAAALAMARRSQIGDRLLAILDPVRGRRPLDRPAVTAAGFAALGLLVPLGAVTARTPAAFDPEAIPVAVVAEASSLAGTAALAPTDPLRPEGLAGTGAFTATTLFGALQDADECRPDAKGRSRSLKLSGSITISGSSTLEDGSGNLSVAWTGADCTVTIRVRGKPQFTAEEDDVASLGGGGRFEATFERGSTVRRYVVTERNGVLDRRFWIDDDRAPLDPAALRWRKTMVLEFIRRSGYDAPARVARIRRAEGLDGLLREIDRIGADAGRARYLEVALEAPGLSATEATALLGRVGTIESDGDRAQVLAALPLRLLSESVVAERYLAAVRGIESDGDKTAVLIRLVRQRPAASTLGSILGLAATIESDGDRAGLLIATIDAYPSAGALPPAFFTAAKGIESDGDLAGVMTHALDAGKVAVGECPMFLGLAGAIESDGDRAGVLIRAIDVFERNPACLVEAVDLATEISSDGDKASVLGRALGLRTPPEAVVAAALDAAATVESDGDRAGVLIRAANRGLIRTPALRRAYLAAARAIESDGDRNNALRALDRREAEQ